MSTKPRVIITLDENGYVVGAVSDQPVEIVVVENNTHLAEVTLEQDFEEDEEYRVIPTISDERDGPTKETIRVGRRVPCKIDFASVVFVHHFLSDLDRMEMYHETCQGKFK